MIPNCSPCRVYKLHKKHCFVTQQLRNPPLHSSTVSPCVIIFSLSLYLSFCVCSVKRGALHTSELLPLSRELDTWKLSQISRIPISLPMCIYMDILCTIERRQVLTRASTRLDCCDLDQDVWLCTCFTALSSGAALAKSSNGKPFI
jgi:hypothetical protein